MKIHRLGLLLVLAASTGCEPDPVEVDCEGPASFLTGTVLTQLPVGLVDADLDLAGTAFHRDRLTIRRILVGGISASNDGFNFDRWSVRIPIQTLISLPRGTDGRAVIVASAFDACEDRTDFATIRLTVGATPGGVVTALDVTATLPQGADFLPANGSVPGIVTVRANPEARGGLVALETSRGVLVGLNATSELRLNGDGMSEASATALLTGDAEGTATVTASSGNRVATETVNIAGPPSLLPSTVGLLPGQTTSVTVLSAGVVAECRATPTIGLTATTGTIDLETGAGAADTTGDGRPDIDIAADPMADELATMEITCRDRYGQSSTGTYSVAPPP